MRKKNFILLFILVFTSLSVMSQTKGMVFEKTTFAKALAKAKQENKNVFVDCYTQWCGPCHYMSTEIFTTDSVGDFMNAKFVNIKIDMEHGEGTELGKNFRVDCFPTFIIFNADGKELGRFTGASLGKPFCNKVSKVLKGQKDVGQNEEDNKSEHQIIENQKKDTIYDEGKGLVFQQLSLNDALAKAQRENKRIFIDCYTSWCYACERMEKTTFKDTRVGNFMNKQYINLRINLEEDPDGKVILDKYKVNVFPACLILNSDGTEYNRSTGYAPVIEFCDKMMKAAMGEEDGYLTMQREQREYYAKIKKERQANLSIEPATIPVTKIKFEKNADLTKAIKKAQKLRRPIHLFLTDGDWQAKYMIDYMFSDDKVADYLNKSFVNVYVDAKSIEGDAIMTKYQVGESFPAFILLNKKGELLGVKNGLFKRLEYMKEDLDILLNSNPQIEK